MKVPIYILFGSNLGDRHDNLNHARHEISRQVGEIITASSVYKTAAWGNVDQPDFYNQVLKIHSSFGPEELLSKLLEIEKKLGRVRHEKWGPRVIDIDLLFYGDVILSNENLTIPHPEIANRRFTLLPLAEIDPNFIHPASQQSIAEMLEACTDTLAVEKL